MLRFPILIGLYLEVPGSGAVFHSASNGANFRGGDWTRIPWYTPNTVFYRGFWMYVLSRFALRLELILNRIQLSAEFNAESNGTSFNGDYGSENLLIPEMIIFMGDFRWISCLNRLYWYDYV